MCMVSISNDDTKSYCIGNPFYVEVTVTLARHLCKSRKMAGESLSSVFCEHRSYRFNLQVLLLHFTCISCSAFKHAIRTKIPLVIALFYLIVAYSRISEHDPGTCCDL